VEPVSVVLDEKLTSATGHDARVPEGRALAQHRDGAEDPCELQPEFA